MTITRGSCAVCGRQSRGYAYQNPNKPGAVTRAACSPACTEKAIAMDKMPFTPDEDTALAEGGKKAGAYLEQIGVFDLRDLSPKEWAEFLRKVLDGYSGKMREYAEELPF